MSLCFQTSDHIQMLHAITLSEAIHVCSSTWMLNLISSSYCGEDFSPCSVVLSSLSLPSCWYFCCVQYLLLSWSLFGDFSLDGVSGFQKPMLCSMSFSKHTLGTVILDLHQLGPQGNSRTENKLWGLSHFQLCVYFYIMENISGSIFLANLGNGRGWVCACWSG